MRLAAIAEKHLVPLIAVNDVLYHVPERRAVAGCRDLHPRARHHRHRGTPARSQCRAASQSLRRKWRACFAGRPRRSIRRMRFLDRCNFSLGELEKTEYPDETAIGYATPQEALVGARRKGSAATLSQRSKPKVRYALDRELEFTAELRYAKYFLTIHEIVALRPLQRHSVPGARLGGELRHLLLPRHHRGRPREGQSSVRAFRFQGTQRTAGHRRRLRARAARRGDPAHLHQIWSSPRRHDGDRHPLSRSQRDPRSRQGIRIIGRHRRRARRHAVGLVAEAA